MIYVLCNLFNLLKYYTCLIKILFEIITKVYVIITVDNVTPTIPAHIYNKTSVSTSVGPSPTRSTTR